MSIRPGTRIAGRYEVAGLPLLGGMGIVYVCFDHQERRPVALKTFKPEYLPDRAARDRFLREGTTWVNLGQHPHIVRAYKVELTSDRQEIYLVLELVAKEERRADASLRSWLVPGKPLLAEQALLFALQVARGMAHAAASIPGFVHRDLKPENLLIGSDRLSSVEINRLRVTDFGLAAVLQGSDAKSFEIPDTPTVSSSGRTQLTQGVVGTPLYMAPEQWQREDVGVETDVYALGCILYEMLVGQQVVEGHSLASLKQAHCKGELRTLPAEFPMAISVVVKRCLAREPGMRYGSWREIEEALTEAYVSVAGRVAPEPESTQALDRAERVAVGWSHNAIGASYMDIGKTKVALNYFEQALETGRVEADRRLEAAGLGGLGIVHTIVGDMKRAIGCHEQSLIINREIGDWYGEGIDLVNLGWTYIALGDARRAIGACEQALAIFRQRGYRHGESAALSNLGGAYRLLGDMERAIGFFKQVLAIAREINDRRGEEAALGDLGVAHKSLGDARRAIGFFEQALIIAREIGDRRGEGNALSNLGEAYKDLGDARRAIGFFEQALEIDRETNNRRGEATDLRNLGDTYSLLRDRRRAIGFYEKQLAIARETSDRRSEGSALGGLGNAYYHLGEAGQAIKFYERKLAIADEIGDWHSQGTAWSNLGIVYGRLGKVQQAIEFCEKASNTFEEIGDTMRSASASFNLAKFLAQQGRSVEALPYAERAAQFWGQTNHPYVQRARALIAQLRGEPPATTGLSPAEILKNFASLIEAVVAAAHGHRAARAQVEASFDTLTRNNWRVADPIQRIWAGERDEAALTAGIDPNSALIVREILKQLR